MTVINSGVPPSSVGVALALDKSGNAYVVGAQGTEKLGPGGETIWLAPSTNGTLAAIALDGSKNVYVTGPAGTARYDTSGSRLWLAESNIGVALSLDSAGNVYVTGPTGTAKLAPSGGILWQAPWTNGFLTALALDQTDNAYVTGSSDWDYVTAKYDTNGNQLWFARFNGRCGLWDVATAIAVDASTNVYVVGGSTVLVYCPISPGRRCIVSLDTVTIKYDGSGNQCWVTRGRMSGDYSLPPPYDPPRPAITLALDQEGNIFVTSPSGMYPRSFSTVKYDRDGDQVWEARNDMSEFSGSAASISTALDNFGNLFVAGTGWNPDGCPEYATLKYVQTESPGFPRITVAPQTQTIVTQAIVTLHVAATGEEPLVYQWLRNGFPIDGANGATLALTNPPTADFAVEVSNALGAIVSREVRVTNLTPVTPCCTHTSDSRIVFSVSGPPDAQYEIQFSTDLLNWQTSAVVWADATGVFRTDLEGGGPHAFYRARMVVVFPSCQGAQ